MAPARHQSDRNPARGAAAHAGWCAAALVLLSATMASSQPPATPGHTATRTTVDAVVEVAPTRPLARDIAVRPALDQPPDPGPAPTELHIADLNLTMSIVPVALTSDGSMELPESDRQAGWYRYGAGPTASVGTTVLASHVDSRQGLGPFAALRTLTEGMPIEVVDADGARHLYRVSTVEQIEKSAIDMAAVFDATGPHELVLVTCGGEFDRASGHYSDNVLVTAIPLP